MGLNIPKTIQRLKVIPALSLYKCISYQMTVSRPVIYVRRMIPYKASSVYSEAAIPNTCTALKKMRFSGRAAHCHYWHSAKVPTAYLLTAYLARCTSISYISITHG